MTYQTIDREVGGTASDQIVILRSRFLAELTRVESEEAAREVIARTRAQYHDARHHCSAFVVGPPGPEQIRRSNDDGEPSGTAGRPMLDVLAGRELSDVVAVVTRWFGGTLLGAGGLVRAYGDAVSAAAGVAGVRQRELHYLAEVTCSMAEVGQFEYRLRHHATVLDTQWADQVTFTVAVRDRAQLADFPAQFTTQVWQDA